MFGYIRPYKPYMRHYEYEIYRSYYCGLCKDMGKRYGQIFRLHVVRVVEVNPVGGVTVIIANERVTGNEELRRAVGDAEEGVPQVVGGALSPERDGGAVGEGSSL